MMAGGELVSVQGDRVLTGAADRDGHRPGVELLADGDRLAPLDHEPAWIRDVMLGRELRGSEDEALLRRDLHVAAGRANDAPDEDVEQDQKGRLQGQQDRLDVHDCSNVTSVRPSRIRSCFSSLARSVRLPFTSIPFVEPRSTMNQFPFSRLTSACLRETLASSSLMSHSRERPRTTTSRDSSYGCLPATVRRARGSCARPSSCASAAETA